MLQAGQGQIPSRQAQIKGGIPKEVPSETVNKVCASGMRSVGLLDQAVRAGDLDVAVGGGMESMSNAPYLLPGARFGFRMGDVTAVDAMTHDGLTNPFTGKQMINEASEVGNELEITRADMDRFAVRSHELAAQGDRRGPARRRDRRGHGQVRARARRSSRPTRRSAPTRRSRRSRSCRPVGGDDATHTAGNSPGVNDGAAAVVVASDEWADAERQARARDGSSPTGRSPTTSRTSPRTPANAAKQALEKVGKSPEDVDLWEINEAFASVALNSMRMLGVDEDRVNVNGGAIALGHPIGASGGRIIGALVHELQRRGGGLGCAAICSGGGQGDAIVIEV